MESELLSIEEEKKVDQRGLIALLEEMQSKYGYLPEHKLVELSKSTGRTLVDIYGVATFYRAFSLKQRGNHLVSVCTGTACHVRNATSITKEFCHKLHVKPGETTEDKEFTLETVNCLGACALGPIVVVDGHYYSNVNTSGVSNIIDKTLEGVDKIDVTTDERIFPVEVSCSRCNHTMMNPHHLIDGYPSIFISIVSNGNHGWLSLSSLYGSYNTASEFNVEDEQVIQMFCSHCHTELKGATNCPECGIKMVPMIIRGGGILQICPRKGCKGHILDLSGTWNY